MKTQITISKSPAFKRPVILTQCGKRIRISKAAAEVLIASGIPFQS